MSSENVNIQRIVVGDNEGVIGENVAEMGQPIRRKNTTSSPRLPRPPNAVAVSMVATGSVKLTVRMVAAKKPLLSGPSCLAAVAKWILTPV